MFQVFVTRPRQHTIPTIPNRSLHRRPLAASHPHDSTGGSAYLEAPPIKSRSASNSAEISSDAAFKFSRRCLREDVPGISRMLGERWRSQARASCMGVTLRDAAAVSSVDDCNGVNPPKGKNGT